MIEETFKLIADVFEPVLRFNMRAQTLLSEC